MMKRMIACLVAALLAFSAAALAEFDDGYIGSMTVVNCEEWVSLRELPGGSATRLKQVPLGATVEDCVRHDDEYIYGMYDGEYGYILAKYLEAAGEVAETREREVYVEDVEEIITEVKYQSGMGFSFWYLEGGFIVDDSRSESGNPSVLMEAWDGEENLPAYLEFLSPEDTGASGRDFLQRLPEQYGLSDVSEVVEEENENGFTSLRRHGYSGEQLVTCYLVTDGEREAQAVSSMDSEMIEYYGPVIDWVIRSIAFD